MLLPCRQQPLRLVQQAVTQCVIGGRPGQQPSICTVQRRIELLAAEEQPDMCPVVKI